MLTQVRRPPEARKTLARKIAVYAVLFITLWSILMFVVIPWESSGEIPDGSFELIEGQRAYAMLVREKRPTLAVAIRGLNMVNAKFTQEKNDEGRVITTGNVRLFYDKHGEFISLEIIKTPIPAAANAAQAADNGANTRPDAD